MTPDEISGVFLGIIEAFLIVLLVIALALQINPFEYIYDVIHAFACKCVEHHLRRERHKKGGNTR